MPSSCETVRNIFEEAQRGFQHHAKLIRALKKIQDGFSSIEEFLSSFVDHLRYAMIVFKREPAVERIVEFAAKYSTSNVHNEISKQKSDQLSDNEDEDYVNSFLPGVIQFILTCNDAKDKAVRFRSCQFIYKILSNMDDEACIDDDIAENILENMLKRLMDKIPAVRVQAVCALSRLQDPTDNECPVMMSYLQLMTRDSSADVRKAVLLNIALNRRSLPEVIARTYDVSETVRKIAYRIIAEKVRIQTISIALRVQLLQNGLNDRSPAVQEVCAKNLLQGWLKSLESNIIELLKSLDIENSAGTAEKTVQVILQAMSKEELKEQIKSLHADASPSVKIPYTNLDCEYAFYWRCLGQHLKSLGVDGEDLFDLLLPEVSEFCEYIQGYIDEVFTSAPVSTDGKVLQQTFVAQQLLMLLGVVDLSDEVGRKRLGQLIHDILVSPYTPESLVELLLSRHSQVQPDEELRIQDLVEIIADVRQPIVTVESVVTNEEQRQKELKLASIKVKLMQLRDDLEESVTSQDFTKAAEIKQQLSDLEEEQSSLNDSTSSNSMAVREEKNDPVTLLKCLTIACEMLQSVTRNGLNPTLHTLVDTLVLPGVQNEDPQVRNAAIKCLGLCALLSCEFARGYLLLFLQVAQVDLELVQLTSLQVVFDLLLKFGLEAFKLNPNKSLPNVDNNDPEKSDEDEDEKSDNGNEEETEETEEKEEKNATDATAMSVLGILTGLLESESNDIRNVAAEGLAKLLLSGRVLSAKLLSRLILLWYNPTTEEDGNLRHCLGVFLPVFAFASRCNQELVEEAFLPTLKTLFSAPSSSPLSSINCNNVAEFLIELSNSRNLTRKTNSTSAVTEGCSHVALGLKVANEILTDPQAPGTRVLCKVLTSLDLGGCDQTSVGNFKVVADELYQTLDGYDSASTKLLMKFQRTLDLLDSNQGEETCNGDTQETNSHDGEEVSTESLTSSQEKESSDNPTDSDITQVLMNEVQAVAEPTNITADDVTTTTDSSYITADNGTDITEDNQMERLKDHTNTKDSSSVEEKEHLSPQASEKEKLPTKTPRTKTSRPKKHNTASKASARLSTSKRTRPKRNTQSVSAVKSKLNLSESEASDKENAVF